MTAKYGKGKNPWTQTPSMARDGAGGAGGTHWSPWGVSSLVLVLWGLCQASRIWSFPLWRRYFAGLDLEGNKPMWLLEPGTRQMPHCPLMSTDHTLCCGLCRRLREARPWEQGVPRLLEVTGRVSPNLQAGHPQVHRQGISMLP